MPHAEAPVWNWPWGLRREGVGGRVEEGGVVERGDLEVVERGFLDGEGGGRESQGRQAKASPEMRRRPALLVIFTPLERWKPVGRQASIEAAGAG